MTPYAKHTNKFWNSRRNVRNTIDLRKLFTNGHRNSVNG